MSIGRSKTSALGAPSGWLVLLTLLAMGGEWVLLVGGTRLQEMIVGLVSLMA